MLVSELVTLLQLETQTDEVIIGMGGKQYTPSLKEYQGVVATCLSESYDFARNYEIRRDVLERDELKLQEQLDNVKDKIGKLKPKP